MRYVNGVTSEQSLSAIIPILEERERAAAERVAELESELAAASGELADARGARLRIERLAGIDRPRGAAPPAPEKVPVNGNRPEGMEAVAIALKGSDKPLTLDELTDAVADLGWRPQTDQPRRAVRAAANRLRHKGADFDFIAKRFAYMPRHADQLPPRLAGVGNFTEPESDD
jgi:hypothetical protein